MKKYCLIGLSVAAMLVFTGCTEIAQDLKYAIAPVATQTTQVSAESEQFARQDTVVQYDSVSLQVPEITRQDVSLTLEAEDAAIPEQCSVVVMPRLGYSGTGYLSGLGTEQGTHLTMQAEIPATQHYDITIVAGSSSTSTCKVLANGETVYTLEMGATDNFVRMTIQGIFLSAGTCELTLEPISGVIDVDCVELANNTSLYDETSAIAAEPVNADASASAKSLFQFLREQYGEKIITGQYVSDSTGSELEEIYKVTGKHPLIRFDDMGRYFRNTQEKANTDVVQASLDWSEEGGIVGLSWYWDAPAGEASVYAEDTSFSLADAVTDADIALCTEPELAEMAASGEISQACYALVQDIDAVSEAMQPLADADIAVLWRPLMEAGGEWYWWGASGAEAYRWLWNLLYTRMTEYHELNNLLWIWNGQSSSYLTDETQYDIASLDLYVEQDETFGSRYEQYVALRNMVPGKMLAISECSTVPDMNAMFRDNAVWSFFGLWYAPYLGEYTSDTELIAIYNSEAAVTREDYQP